MVRLDEASRSDHSASSERMPGELAATAVGLTKVYGEGNTEVVALDHVDIGFETGKLTAIMGPSGSGKSTLSHCVAGLDEVTDGGVRIGDTSISELSVADLVVFLRDGHLIGRLEDPTAELVFDRIRALEV